jgi:hypothetical protein
VKTGLKLKRELRLAPYTPKPGDKMFNTLEVEVYRDANRKRIRFWAQIMSIGHENGFTSRSFMIGADHVSIVVSESPTHAPKKFAELADPIMASIDSRSGYWWSECQSYLDRLGIALAEQPMVPA